MTAIGHWSKEYAGSGFDVGNVFTNLDDVSGNVAARDLRERHAGNSLADKKIQMIEGDSLYANEHLIFAENGIGDVLVLQNFGSTVLVDAYGFHGHPRGTRHCNTLPDGDFGQRA
jgi:hypothetical protein